MALADLQRLARYVESKHLDVGVITTVPPGVRYEDRQQILQAHKITLDELPLEFETLPRVGALNQIPTELLFRDGQLVARQLGPMSFDELKMWVAPSASLASRRAR